MIPRLKRLLWRATLLAVAVNILFLLMQYQKRGRLFPQDYLLAGESLATTLALLGAVGFIGWWLGRKRHGGPPGAG